MKKVKHIKGNNTARLCGSKGTYEPVGTADDIPICKKCHAIHTALTGEVITGVRLE